jgi:predicted TIM-barrel fold metal-dependent hydrolase
VCDAVPTFVPPEVLPLHATPEELAREARRRRSGLLDGVVDVHTHLFPSGFLRALRGWFDAHAWRIRFRGDAEEALEALRSAGVTAQVALVYAHKPGAAEVLNAFVAELCRAHPNVVGVGTVLPGEPDAKRIVRDAIGVHGLRGIKLHCHVQRMPIDDPRVLEVLAECAAIGVPAVVHTGREPRVPAYGVDTHALCAVSRTERVLQALPRLRLVVPHLGYDELSDHFALLDRHENLMLDTTMLCADYLRPQPDLARVERHADRIMYGSDFPIIPYEPDREIVVLARRIGSDEALERILRRTARAFWGMGPAPGTTPRA